MTTPLTAAELFAAIDQETKEAIDSRLTGVESRLLDIRSELAPFMSYDPNSRCPNGFYNTLPDRPTRAEVPPKTPSGHPALDQAFRNFPEHQVAAIQALIAHALAEAGLTSATKPARVEPSPPSDPGTPPTDGLGHLPVSAIHLILAHLVLAFSRPLTPTNPQGKSDRQTTAQSPADQPIHAGMPVLTPACAAALRRYGIAAHPPRAEPQKPSTTSQQNPSPVPSKSEGTSVAEQKTPSAIQKAGDFGKDEGVQKSWDPGTRHVTQALTAQFEGVEYSLAHIPDISPCNLVTFSRLKNRVEAVFNGFGYAVEPVLLAFSKPELGGARFSADSPGPHRSKAAIERMLLQLQALHEATDDSNKRVAISRAIAAISAI